MKFLLLMLTGISFLILPGCIEVNTLIRLNSDGTGTIEETVLMGKEMAAMISEFSKSFSEDSTGNVEEFSLFNEEELKTKAADFGSSVSYVSGKEISPDGKEGYTATYKFLDINTLKINQNPSDKVTLDQQGVSNEEEKEEVKFSFTKGSPATLVIDFPEPEFDETDSTQITADSAATDSSAYDQLFQLMADLKMSLTLNVEGNISETNASFVNGSEVTLFNINFGALLKNQEKLNQFKQVNPQNFDEIKNLLKDIEGIKIELNDPVTIKFN